MQLSNVPEVRPARRLLVVATLIFAFLFVLNLAGTYLSFRNGYSDRWMNVLRLLANLVVAVLLYRGYVALAMLAERASIYKQALDEELPRLRAAVAERTQPGSATRESLDDDPAPGPGPGGADALSPGRAVGPRPGA